MSISALSISPRSHELLISSVSKDDLNFARRDFKLPLFPCLSKHFLCHDWVKAGKLDSGQEVVVKTRALAKKLGIEPMHVPQWNAEKLIELHFTLKAWEKDPKIHPDERDKRSHLALSLLTYTEHAVLPMVSLAGNSLTALPPIFHLPMFRNMQSLDVSSNSLTTLPSLEALKGLRSLNLSKNPMMTLPDSVRQLTNLRHLDLRETRITELPSWLQERQAKGMKIIV